MSIKVMGMVWANGPERAADRLMLLAIADNANDEGVAWPGIGTLARKCCVTENPARETVRRLEAAGWITTHIGGGTIDGETGRPNRYQIVLSRLSTPLSAGGKGEATPLSTEGYPPVDSAATPLPTGGEPSLEPSMNHTDTRDPFEEVLKHYPRVDRPKVARAAYIEALKSTDHATIVTSIKAQRPGLLERETRYVPDLVQWLRDERWTAKVDTKVERDETTGCLPNQFDVTPPTETEKQINSLIRALALAETPELKASINAQITELERSQT